MNLHHAYQSRELTDMTRIEMLLKLYTETIGSIEVARAAADGGEQEVQRDALHRARRFVLGLLAGINRDYPVGEDQHRLLVFVMMCLQDDTQDLDGALQVLQTLRDAFQEIEDKAIELELKGEIPPLAAEPAGMNTQV